MNLKTIKINDDHDLFLAAKESWLDNLKDYEEHFSTIGYQSYLAFIEKRINDGWDPGTETYAVCCGDSSEVQAFFELSHAHPKNENGYLKILNIRMNPLVDSRVPEELAVNTEMERLTKIQTIASHVLTKAVEMTMSRDNCSRVKILSTKQVDREFFVNFANNFNPEDKLKYGFDVKQYSGGMWLEISIL